MRRTNWRVAIVGFILVAGAAAFFFGMETTAPKSNNPVDLMTTVGQVSGSVGAIGLAMLAVGLIGRRNEAKRRGASGG
jgi:hypothetical protein